MMSRSYPQILKNLSAVLSREDNDLVKDNISAALARLIMTNMDSVPMDQVSRIILFVRIYSLSCCFPGVPGIAEESSAKRRFPRIYINLEMFHIHVPKRTFVIPVQPVGNFECCSRNEQTA